MRHNRLALALLMVALLVGCATPNLPPAGESIPTLSPTVVVIEDYPSGIEYDWEGRDRYIAEPVEPYDAPVSIKAVEPSAEDVTTRAIPKTMGVMFNFTGDNVQELTGVVASVVVFEVWDRVAPGPGQFNPAALDRIMALYADQTVTLLDGTVIPVPIVTQLMPYLSGEPNQPAGVDFADRTPQWVYKEQGVPHEMIGDRAVGYLIDCPAYGRSAMMPRFDSLRWWELWFQTVSQFAAWAEGYPQIVGVVTAMGLDGETQAIKNWSGCQYATFMSELPGVERAWAKGVEESISVYAEAFGPTGITVWLNNTPGGFGRPVRAALALQKGLSLKHSGGVPDISWAHGIGTISGTGSWDYMRDNRAAGFNAWESAFDIGRPEDKYWSVYAMLAVGWPAAMDLHSGYFPVLGANPVNTEFLNWAAGWLGYSPTSADGAWIVFRDYEDICQGNYCWWPGDFTMGAERVRGGEKRVMRWQLPVDDGTYPGRQSRIVETDLAVDFATFVRVGGSNPQLSLTFLNYGTDTFSVGYRDQTDAWVWSSFAKGPALGPVNSWITLTMGVPKISVGGDEDVRIMAQGDGAEYVHKLELRDDSGPTRTPSPTVPTSTPSLVPSYTPTRTATRTVTPSPTKLDTPTPSPVATYTPTPTGEPSVTPSPTITPSPTTASSNDYIDAARWLLERENPGYDVEIVVNLYAR